MALVELVTDPPKKLQAKDPALPAKPQPYPDLVRDVVGNQARAELDFEKAQLQSGWDLIRDNRPIDTAADLANVTLARAGMFPDPIQAPQPKPDDPLGPIAPPDPMKPGG